MASLIGKGRRPKFELHLKIYDLNNVPLVSGSSFIKWHLAHSMHAEHRGRTSKCPIANHKVDYSFSKLVPSIRISMDRSNNLTECPIEFEIIQEFPAAEKITLGYVRLNLSEFVEESETFGKDTMSPPRKRHSSSSGGLANGAKAALGVKDDDIEDGIIRRYLMQDSKVNSTLKIGILMVQVDGERNFIAPILKTAPVFGGIAGIMAPEQAEDEPGSLPNIAKSRDTSEVHDLYRRTLAAFWFSQPQEAPADECIEDIFAGGNGWKTKHESSGTGDSDDDDAFETNGGTLRPSDIRRMTKQSGRSRHNQHTDHQRSPSAHSDKSASTVTGGLSVASGSGSRRNTSRPRSMRMARDESRDRRASGGNSGGLSPVGLSRDRSGSLQSFASTMDSEQARSGMDVRYKSTREISESEVRDDLVAWSLPSNALST